MVEHLAEHVERRLRAIVTRLLDDEPVILLQGPRAVGKSTLLRDVAHRAQATVIDLDDLANRTAVMADPGLYAAAPPPIIFDEFQHVPELLDAIKAELNVGLRPGRFLLAGSTSYASLPSAAQSLTGRLHRVDVWPLSQSELAATTDTFIDRVFDEPATLAATRLASTTRAEYVERVTRGGFPIAVSRTGAGRRVDRPGRHRRAVHESSRIGVSHPPSPGMGNHAEITGWDGPEGAFARQRARGAIARARRGEVGTARSVGDDRVRPSVRDVLHQRNPHSAQLAGPTDAHRTLAHT